MKPRTKLHFRVTTLSKLLPKLSSEQEQWAFQNCLKHWGYRTKTNTSCMDCGHIWPTADNRGLIAILCETECECPGCGAKLAIVNTRKKNVTQRSFTGLIGVSEEFQVNRFFEIRSHHKAGKPVTPWIHEVVQQWLQPGGKNEVIAQNRGMGYCDHFHGGLEIRDRNLLNSSFNMNPIKLLPNIKFQPIYKRNGFKGRFGEVSPYDMFTSIISDPKAETLLKAKQMGLLAAMTNNRRWDVVRYWNSIKICIRNKYKVPGTGTTWLDYVQLLDHFKKDLHNPKYVCPTNLKKEHDKLVAKKKEIDDHERYTRFLVQENKYNASFKNLSAAGIKAEYDRVMAEKNEAQRQRTLEKQRQQAAVAQGAYEKAKKAFFGLVFSSEDLTVKFLENLEDFIKEADTHKHCVFTNEYYKKADSLIFSASLNGKLLETVEVSISQMKVIQSRGIGNKATKYNQQIVDLVNKNLGFIKKRYKESKTKTLKTSDDIAA